MRLGWGLSSAPDAAQQECCEPGSTLLCMGLFSRFFVQALPCTAEGTLCRVRDSRSLVPRADGTNRSNANSSCVSARLARAQPHPGAQEFLRIDRVAVDPGFIVQMRTGRAAGRADRADHLADLD